MDDRSRFHDAERESGSAVRNLIGQIIVELPGIHRVGAASRRRRTGAVPERHSDTRQESIAAELRLLYVAVTRAKYAVDLPQSLLRRFGLNRTTSEVVGAPSVAEAIVDNGPTSEDPRLAGVVSPYHSPAKGEPREMTSLRRIFG